LRARNLLFSTGLILRGNLRVDGFRQPFYRNAREAAAEVLGLLQPIRFMTGFGALRATHDGQTGSMVAMPSQCRNDHSKGSNRENSRCAIKL
jgi:hypothetical protein